MPSNARTRKQFLPLLGLLLACSWLLLLVIKFRPNRFKSKLMKRLLLKLKAMPLIPCKVAKAMLRCSRRGLSCRR